MDFQTKTALVTGGSRGLGRDMALTLARAGHNVALTYHTNQAEAAKVAAEIQGMGRCAQAFQLDVAQFGAYPAFLQQVSAWLEQETGSPRFDFLINNAGTGIYVPFTDTTEDQLDSMIGIHYKSVYLLTQKALSYMNDGGRIVNISSGLARFSQPGSSAYAAMKGAVEVLTRYLARELGTRGITANVVAPGPIETDFGGGRIRNSPEMKERLSAMTPLGRVGQADDIGGVVAFLCSDAAKWVNGQRIEAAGGINV